MFDEFVNPQDERKGAHMQAESDRRNDEHVHVHLHFDGPVTLNINVTQEPPPAPLAQSATLTMEDGSMSGVITVDTGGKVKINFNDDKGDTDAAPPTGNGSGPVVYTFSSDNPAVATVAQDPTNPLEGDVTGVTEGKQVGISATILNTDGSPVLEPDGVTPFTVSPVLIDVDAGNAVSASLAQE